MSGRRFVFLLVIFWAAGWIVNLPAENTPATDSTSAAAPTKEKGQGRMVTLSDFGAEDLGYLSIPDKPPIGGIVLIHDRWGLDDHTKEWTDKLAALGYLTVAVDLYNGRQLNDAGLANQVVAGLRTASALRTIQAGVRLLRESPRLKVGRVALAGFGVGGEITLRAASDIKGLDAVAAVDPGWSEDPHRFAKTRLPACIIFARSDKTSSTGQALEWQKVAQHNSKEMEMHGVEARTGFADPNNPAFEAAGLARSGDIMSEFFARELSKPPEPTNLIDKVKEKVEKIF